jgi:hypothetical protein
MAQRIDPDTTSTAFDRLREAPALQAGPGVEEWPLRSPPDPRQLEAALKRLGLSAVVVQGRDALRFEGWRTPPPSSLVIAVALAVVILVGALAVGVVSLIAGFFLMAAVFAVLFGMLPEYRVTGSVGTDRVLVRLVSKGLLARRREMEKKLREALGASPGKPS